ncbi:MAG: saccharopine dehydrogenase NADP-binding domain-containing protein [Hyphomicrobiaceae bacterium]|nr:saccharopine dehydrogenase NADP-binding domain-containing protein [Hyphomicrobiaceae bacterium]
MAGDMVRIVIVGGYGVFGRRAAERLAGRPGIDVVVAGRSLAMAEALARDLAHARAGAGRTVSIEAARLDVECLTADDLRALGAGIVINTVGPFQARDYRVARAAIAAGAHYVDLADARAFVNGIGALDAEARAAGVLVCSGASSVPALAAAVIDDLASRLARLDSVRYLISPGNSFDPGPATTAAVLGGVGRPFTTLAEGRMRTAHGWQPLLLETIDGVGTRLLGACDVPDLDLFPERYPSLRSQTFLAGVEVKAFHLGLYALSWIVRAGLLDRPELLATPLLALKRRLGVLGSDRGAMVVEAAGPGRTGGAGRLRWTLVAPEGKGPFIPATPAVIVAKRLVEGRIGRRGATACVGLFTLQDFEAEVADLNLLMQLDVHLEGAVA